MADYSNFELMFPFGEGMDQEKMQSLFDALLQDMEGFEDILIKTIEEVTENQTLTTDPLPITSLPAMDPLPTTSLPTTDPLLTIDSLLTTDPLPTMATRQQNNSQSRIRSHLKPMNQEMQRFATKPSKRFKSLDETALKTLEVNAYSKATKQNTKWGVRVFNG